MENDANVRFVNPHTESVGRHHDGTFPFFPGFLPHCPLERRQPGMVISCPYAFGVQEGGKFLGSHPFPDVDNGTGGQVGKDVQCFT